MKDKMFHTDSCRIGGQYGMSNLSDGPGKRPPYLRNTDLSRVIGRTIDNASPYLGSYGMGGPGFIGWHLKANKMWGQEWLVLTMWGAAEWLLVNGRVLDCYPFDGWPEKYNTILHRKSTRFSDQAEIIKNLFCGRKIKKFELADRSFKMLLTKQGKCPMTVKLPTDLTKLAPHGSGEIRTWDTEEKMIDGFILSPTEYISI